MVGLTGLVFSLTSVSGFDFQQNCENGKTNSGVFLSATVDLVDQDGVDLRTDDAPTPLRRPDAGDGDATAPGDAASSSSAAEAGAQDDAFDETEAPEDDRPAVRAWKKDRHQYSK